MSTFIDQETGYPMSNDRRTAIVLAQQITADTTIGDRDVRKILAVALSELFVDYQRMQDRRERDGIGLSDWRAG